MFLVEQDHGAGETTVCGVFSTLELAKDCVRSLLKPWAAFRIYTGDMDKADSFKDVCFIQEDCEEGRTIQYSRPPYNRELFV